MEVQRNIKVSSPAGKPVLIDLFYPSDGKRKPIIIFCHGFKGFKDWGCWNVMAEEAARAGVVFLKFNFSHNGTTINHPDEFADLEAFAQNNFSKEIQDLDAVIDWVIETPLVPETEKDRSQIYLIGHSRGGSTALLHAAENSRVKKVVTWAAVADLHTRYSSEEVADWKLKGRTYVENARTGQDMPLDYQLVEDLQAHPQRLSVKHAVEKLQIPIMAIHGTEDAAVNFEDAIQLKRYNQNVQLNLVPNANHVFGSKHPWEQKRLPEDLHYALSDSLKFFGVKK